MFKMRIDAPALTDKQIQAFWSYINKNPGQGPRGDCWIWTGGMGRRGYGQTSIRCNGGAVRPRTFRSSRVVYFLTTGKWPAKLVLHSCDNPPCCNPEHLSVGTQKKNREQCKARGRTARGKQCGVYTHPERYPRGIEVHKAKLTEDNVRQIRKLAESTPRKQIEGMFPVGKSTIGQIIRRKIWKHLTP